MKRTTLTLLLLLFVLNVFSQDTTAIDTPQRMQSPLKSLSDTEYANLVNGEEMGMARVAELNHYPSPQGVSKLEKQLGLSAAQKIQLTKIIDAWSFKAKEMGRFILTQETRLNTLFASGKATDGAVIYYTNKIGLYLGELRNAHLQAHLKVRNMLTKEQIKKYYQLTAG